MTDGRAEFHAHTTLSDGELTPLELIRRAEAAGHRFLAITDHVGIADIGPVVARLRRECATVSDLAIQTVPGVELTHVPPRHLDEAVRSARRAGARIVIVHGETLSEPVAAGTNRAAAMNPDVDVLAHPGLLDPKDAEVARAHGVCLELSARPIHATANGRVARLAEAVEADPIVDSDAHGPNDLIPQAEAVRFAQAAGLSPGYVRRATLDAPDRLIRRILQNGP